MGVFVITFVANNVVICTSVLNLHWSYIKTVLLLANHNRVIFYAGVLLKGKGRMIPENETLLSESLSRM